MKLMVMIALPTRASDSRQTLVRWTATAVPLGIALLAGGCTLTPTPECPAGLPHRITTIRESGGRVDWASTGDLIAFDKVGEGQYYDVYVMRPDGSEERCLTCGKAGSLPQKNSGNPAWHPSGQWIIFQAEEQDHPGISYWANPSLGVYGDLWLMDSEGEQFHRLTNLPDTADYGVLHPHFSRDGKRLSWSQMHAKADLTTKGKELGYWTLMIGTFSVGDEGPQLTDIHEYQPGGEAFYENHGFSPDGSKLLFTSNYARGGSAVVGNDISAMDLDSLSVQRLTRAKRIMNMRSTPLTAARSCGCQPGGPSAEAPTTG